MCKYVEMKLGVKYYMAGISDMIVIKMIVAKLVHLGFQVSQEYLEPLFLLRKLWLFYLYD